MNNISLSEMIPTEVLQTIQDAFSEYSGLAAMIADANGVPVTKQSNFTDFCKLTRASKCGSENCQKCGREGAKRTLTTGKPAVYQCHTGMVDFAAPILMDGEYIGHFAGGQTRVEELDEEFIRAKAREYDIDEETYLEAARRNNVTDWEWVEKSAKFLSHIAGALSQIAYERIQVLHEKKIIEKTADTQLNFMRQYADGANKGIQEFIDYLSKIANGEISDIGQIDRNYLGDMSGELQSRITSINNSVVQTEVGMGSVTLNEDRYDVRMLLDRKITELAAVGELQGCTLHFEVSDDIPQYLVGDSAKMAELIDNVVVATFKNEKPKNIWGTISSEKSGYGVDLVVRLVDDGDGLSEAKQSDLVGYIRSRTGREVISERLDIAEITEIGHLLNLMSGSVDIKRGEQSGLDIVFRIPQFGV